MVSSNTVDTADVLVRNGKIVAIGEGVSSGADRAIDASGLFLLPGLVDPEAHLGVTRAFHEDLTSESRAAVASGITTWGVQQVAVNTGPDYIPNPSPDDHVSWLKQLPQAIDTINRVASNDVFLTAAVMTNEQAEEVLELAETFGVTSFKMYMHLAAGPDKLAPKWYAGRRIHEFDDGTVYRVMRQVSRLGYPGLLSIHCENWDISWVLEEDLRREGRQDMAAWEAKSPAFVEAGHVRTYAYYAGVTGCPLHIQHVTTPETVAEIERARAEGIRIFGQTGHHYLVLDRSAWKINVPLRSQEVRDWLWRAVRQGRIDAIGSDHVGQTKTKEEMLADNVWDTGSGFPSRVEMLLPAMLSEGVSRGRVDLQDVVRLCSENPARLWGVFPRKGRIAVGADADICFVDMGRKMTVSAASINSAASWSLFEGWQCTGWPVATMLRGSLVAVWPEEQDSAKITNTPMGRYLPRSTEKVPYENSPERLIR